MLRQPLSNRAATIAKANSIHTDFGLMLLLPLSRCTTVK